MGPNPDPAAGVQVGRLDGDIDGVGERGLAEVFASDPAAPHRQLAHGAQEALDREPKDFAQ
ncbi:hypothetical protein [Streptomyces niveus]|uniref:hypothetical protein n=1 Tax=Streptomyces niveus TaxID=193462 RepID=UPI00344D255F